VVAVIPWRYKILRGRKAVLLEQKILYRVFQKSFFPPKLQKFKSRTGLPLDQRADKISSAIILFTILDEDGN
jgi:DNA-binding helix-hairpin-helix protein with protein kinase domain